MDLIKMQIMKYLKIVSKSFDNSFDLLTTWYYISNQKIIEKSQEINLKNQAMLLAEIFITHNSRTKILPYWHFLQNASQE